MYEQQDWNKDSKEKHDKRIVYFSSKEVKELYLPVYKIKKLMCDYIYFSSL